MNHVNITIDVGDADVIDLKIKSGAVIGTLHIEKKGLAFSPPNTKKEPEHTLKWNQLPQLIALSNGFARIK